MMEKIEIAAYSIGPVGSTLARSPEGSDAQKASGILDFMLKTPKPAMPKK